MNKSESLYERIMNHVPKGTWFELSEICQMVNSKAKSYVKMTLFAMPNVQAERVLNPHSPTRSIDAWKWRFKVISED